MCVKTLLTNGDVQKNKEHAGEVWHSNVIESGAHDNFPHSAYVRPRIRKSPVLELAVPVSELAGFLAIFRDF
jgi:hypothetical protein